MNTLPTRNGQLKRFLRNSLPLLLLFFSSISWGQVNHALTAVASQSGGGVTAYGPENYNDNVIPPYGTLPWGWVTTSGWIEYTWSSAVSFDKVNFFKDNRPMITCEIQYWDGSSYVKIQDYNNSAIDDSVLFNTVTTTKLRLNIVAGSSNPNFREIQVWETDSCKNITTPPVANFLAPDTVFVNSPTLIYNGSPEEAPENYKWYVGGSFTTYDLNLNLLQLAPGNIDVKLVVEGCLGMDSITKSLLVANPVLPPAAYFVADTNTAEIFEEIHLTDLSTGGAVAWEYTIDPDSVFDSYFQAMVPSYNFINSTEFSQNPTVVFNYPGTYTICQKVTNAIGSNSDCHVDYVVIRSSTNMCLETSTTVPSGVLYDDGGPAINYGDGRNGLNLCHFLIDPCASEVKLNLKQFDLISGDYLRVYDGMDNTGTPLWNVNASPNGMTGGLNNNSVNNPLIASSGRMYIEFESDAKGNATGFAAEWTSIAGSFPAPTAAFDMPDTACINLPVGFESTSLGSGIIYKWDVLADGVTESNGNAYSHTFKAPGTYPVRLIVKNCGGEDTITKDIIVVVPNAKPRPGFMVENPRPSVGETVLLNDTTAFCADPNLYEWTITPNTFIFVNGTDEFSVNPQVKFLAAGFYDVMLKVENSFGSDAVLRPNYIQAIQYCPPVVNAPNSDAGISRVSVNKINNISSAGQEKYTNFSETASTPLERKNDYVIVVQRPTANNPVSRGIWIDFNRDGDFDDADETIVSVSGSTGTSWSDTISVPATATLGISRLRVGIAVGNSLNACGPAVFGEFEDYKILITQDQTPPVITMIGADTIRIERCDTYTDLGATAEDNIDGNITSQIVTMNNVNTTKSGIYTVTYNVQDVVGNMAHEKLRIVIVIGDTTNPVITMAGKNPDTVDVNMTYTDPSFTATDNCSGVMSQTTTGSVNTALPGIYILTYTVDDSAGNVAVETRTVIVADREAPILTLNGNATDTIELCSPYNDAGASATDNFDPSVSISVSGNLDTETPGTYTLSYCATDAAGNGAACINRDVVVMDTHAPVISFTGKDTVNLEVFGNYKEPGIAIDDLCNDDWTMTTSGTWTGIADKLGCFSLIYTATDASGNSSNKERTICVADNTPPQIALNDDPVVYLLRFEPWSDPYAVATDNFDPSPIINTNSSFKNTLMPGTYHIAYQAVDASGNKSEWVDRLVIVSKETTGIEDNSNAVMTRLFPNPTEGRFQLDVELPETMDTRISILNALGQEIRLIENSAISTGTYSIDLSNEGSGIYMICIETNSSTLIKKVNVVR